MGLLIFFLGAAVGSFLNVVAVRYDPDRFIWDKKAVGGRSHCPFCGKELRWFELVPVFSFLQQKGRCRNCGSAISPQYPLAEIAEGLLFVFVPLWLRGNFYLTDFSFYFLSVLWIAVFSLLLLVSLIDFRLQIIPNEIDVLLLLFGLLIVLFQPFDGIRGSFLGHYSILLGWRENLWLNRLIAEIFGISFFVFLILVTKGKAMGVGDLKLVGVLSFIFGWPDIVFIVALSFVIGSLAGAVAMIWRKKTLKSYLAFGPFLGLASLTTFAFGYRLVDLYFGLLKG